MTTLISIAGVLCLGTFGAPAPTGSAATTGTATTTTGSRTPSAYGPACKQPSECAASGGVCLTGRCRLGSGRAAVELQATIAVADPTYPTKAPQWLRTRGALFSRGIREHLSWTGLYEAEWLAGWDRASSTDRARRVSDMQARGVDRMVAMSVFASPDPGVAMARVVVYDMRRGGVIADLGGTVRLPAGAAWRQAADWVNRLAARDTGVPGSAGSRLLASIQVKPGIKEIGVMDVDGRNFRLLTRTGGLNLDPAWGPRSGVGYMSYRRSNADWMLDGRPLSQRPGLNAVGAWSADGSRLALTLSAGAHTDVVIIDASTGREVSRVTAHASVNTSPSWSPDGRKIAFVSDRSGGPNVWISNLKTGKSRRLTAGYCGSPDWSPIGDTILYAQMVGGGKFAVMRHDLDTGRTRRLTAPEASAESPAFSPHGRYIAYVHVRADKWRELWLMDADGRRARRIGPTQFQTFAPSWGGRVR